MIAAISWVPKGVAKSLPEVAELPSKEEIDKLLQSGVLHTADVEHDDDDDEEEDEDMDAESTKEVDEVALASVAAEALGKDSGDIAGAFRELDMEHYDEEDDDGIDVFSKGLGDAYYPSSELDPYLEDKDDNDS